MRIVVGLALVVLSTTEGWTQVRTKGDRVTPELLTLAKLTGLAIPQRAVPGGDSAYATVTLSGRAPGAVRVNVSSSNPIVATVPGSIEIPRGNLSASFRIATRGVLTETEVTIAASYGGSSVQAPLTVKPAQLLGIGLRGLGPARPDGHAYGGNPLRVWVELDGAAPPDGAVVLLSNSHPSLAAIPGFLKVPEGATSISVDSELAAVSEPAEITVRASYASGNGPCGPPGCVAQLPVLPPHVALVGGIALTPPSVLGGSAVSGEITLTGAAPSQGWEVRLSSTGPVVAPALVTVPQGSRRMSFTVTTNPVASRSDATIVAEIPHIPWYYPNPNPQATLRIDPPALQDLVIEPSTASYQSDSVEGRVSLTGPAPSGLSVPLSWASTEAATVPERVMFEEGATTATFPVTLKPVTAPTQFTLSAFLGTRKTTTLTVNP